MFKFRHTHRNSSLWINYSKLNLFTLLTLKGYITIFFVLFIFSKIYNLITLQSLLLNFYLLPLWISQLYNQKYFSYTFYFQNNYKEFVFLPTHQCLFFTKNFFLVYLFSLLINYIHIHWTSNHSLKTNTPCGVLTFVFFHSSVFILIFLPCKKLLTRITI